MTLKCYSFLHCLYLYFMQADMDWVLKIFGTQVIKKKQLVRFVFPDYLSVSYDYDWKDPSYIYLSRYQLIRYLSSVLYRFWNSQSGSGWFDVIENITIIVDFIKFHVSRLSYHFLGGYVALRGWGCFGEILLKSEIREENLLLDNFD